MEFLKPWTTRILSHIKTERSWGFRGHYVPPKIALTMPLEIPIACFPARDEVKNQPKIGKHQIGKRSRSEIRRLFLPKPKIFVGFFNPGSVSRKESGREQSGSFLDCSRPFVLSFLFLGESATERRREKSQATNFLLLLSEEGNFMSNGKIQKNLTSEWLSRRFSQIA